MPNSPWQWLNEAANLLTDHFAKENPEQYKIRKKALRQAHKELLDQAHRGALKIEGKRGDPLEREPHISSSDWEVIPSSIWDAKFEKTGRILSAINRVIIWDTNCVSYEEEGVCFGFSDLRVKTTELVSIWHLQKTFTPNENIHLSSTKETTKSKNKGGRPAEYKHALLAEIERIERSPEGLPHERGLLFRMLRDFQLPHWPPGDPSDGTIRYAIRAFHQKPGS